MDQAVAQSLLSIEAALDDEMNKIDALGVRCASNTPIPPLMGHTQLPMELSTHAPLPTSPRARVAGGRHKCDQEESHAADEAGGGEEAGVHVQCCARDIGRPRRDTGWAWVRTGGGGGWPLYPAPNTHRASAPIALPSPSRR